MQLQIGDRTYVNSEAVVRWDYCTKEICAELTLKDVFYIEATLWLADGTNVVINTPDALEELAEWANGLKGMGLNPTKETFGYYVVQRSRFERLAT